jgi:hypothetical protein
MFVNRPRLYDLTRGSADLQAQFRWETINAVLYKIGGVVFIVGSVLFFPRFEAYADLGAWTFFFGSLLYLVVTGHDMAEAVRYQRQPDARSLAARLELVAAAAYLIGTILFTVGSIFFLSTVGWFTAGAWCFVVGSLLFVLGACINVLQIVQAETLLTLQLMNLTAITFVVGAVLFTVASIPYLWGIESAEDRVTIYDFLAWQYLVGSLLFLLGGIFNYWRAYVVVQRAIQARDGGAAARAASEPLAGGAKWPV